MHMFMEPNIIFLTHTLWVNKLNEYIWYYLKNVLDHSHWYFTIVSLSYATFAWMYLIAGTFKNAGMAFITYVCINLFIGINTIISSSVVYMLLQQTSTTDKNYQVFNVLSLQQCILLTMYIYIQYVSHQSHCIICLSGKIYKIPTMIISCHEYKALNTFRTI